jgi:hypothetical protein
MEILGWIVVIVFVLLAIFAADRYLWVKEIEKDLKEYLGDVQVARDSSEPPFSVHFEAQVLALKHLIRKHFVL